MHNSNFKGFTCVRVQGTNSNFGWGSIQEWGCIQVNTVYVDMDSSTLSFSSVSGALDAPETPSNGHVIHQNLLLSVSAEIRTYIQLRLGKRAWSLSKHYINEGTLGQNYCL